MDMWKCHAQHKTRPLPDEDSLIFWQGCYRSRLLIQQCDACHGFRFPPSPVCPHCLASFATWREDPGAGHVVTFCVYRSELAGPAWRSELPYVVAVIQLEFSGINILSNVLCEQVESVRIGMAVRMVFETADGNVRLPKFVPLFT